MVFSEEGNAEFYLSKSKFILPEIIITYCPDQHCSLL